MKRKTGRLRAGLFALTVAGALGFGGAQALAAPAEAQAAPDACIQSVCNVICQALVGANGRCFEGRCLCPL